jgi:hypothetical protein
MQNSFSIRDNNFKKNPIFQIDPDELAMIF